MSNFNPNFLEKNNKSGALLVRGQKIANEIIDDLKSRPKPKKFLAAVLVGADPASVSFLQQKEKTAKELGVDFRLYKFPAETKNDALREEVGKISSHKTCGGVIVQLPLPGHLNRHYILNAIPREKDVDVLSERSLGAFYAGRNPVLPPAVGVVETILKIMNYKLRMMRVAVIGRGLLIGRPIGLWLQDKVSELTIFGSATENLRNKLKEFDLVISGVGKTALFSSENLKEGATVIDFGYDFNNGKISGDFNPIIHNSGFLIHYTPTPGGTGPILVAKLFDNFYGLNTKQQF